LLAWSAGEPGGFFLTGPLARQWNRPEVEVVRLRYGTGLLAHLVARVVEMVRILRDIQDFGDALCDDYGSQTARGPGEAVAVVEAARGRLVHAISLQPGGHVARYKILAPTEWNFHPDGPLKQGLVGSLAGEDADILVRQLVLALDPCVAYRIKAA
jgi:coenzyme F420-reducing hydrogenase alpha subunit